MLSSTLCDKAVTYGKTSNVILSSILCDKTVTYGET